MKLNLLKLLGISRDIPEQDKVLYKRMIQEFFDGRFEGSQLSVAPKASNRLITLMITGIEFRGYRNGIVIHITLCKPGLLIGKKGATVRALAEYLSIDKQVSIKISQSDLWSGVWRG